MVRQHRDQRAPTVAARRWGWGRGDDEAVGSNYVQAFRPGPEGGQPLVAALAVNEDRYIRTPDGWKISHRVTSPTVDISFDFQRQSGGLDRFRCRPVLRGTTSQLNDRSRTGSVAAVPELRPSMPDIGGLFRLDGQTAVITGGGSGIGRGSAHALAQAGADIVLLDLDAELVAETADEVGGRGVAIDVTDEAAVVDTFAGLDRCDVLVTCAGRSLRAPSLDTSMSDWQAVVDLNLTATFLCAREAARHMTSTGGSIVALSSMMGHVGGRVFPNPAYHASKGGVINLVRALALEWAIHDIRVNSVAPTFVETPFITLVFEQPETVQAILDNTPLGRMATVTDVAAAVLYLATPASGMVTGTSLPVDGGWLAH